MSMKPGAKGKSDMSNKELKKFEEECLEWFEATAIGRLPQSNQTLLFESVSDETLRQRTLMALKERTKKNFFPAAQLLDEASKHRDTLMYPKIVQTWEFIRRYVSESDKLNWGTEPACRATMREVLAAAEDCEILGGPGELHEYDG
jgi:hypothetical protein